MAISYFRKWIERRRPVWLVAVLFASTLAVGTCMATPAMAKAATAVAPVGDCPMLQHSMPAACCLNFDAAAHAVTITANDATPHLSTPPAGYAAIATAAFAVPTVEAEHLFRPPIRAPAAPAHPLYLLNCALLN